MQINQTRLLERFLRYVQVATPADPRSTTYPSSECQKDLAKMLAEELAKMGAEEVQIDPNSLVWATVPASAECATAPVVALVAHVDTSPEAPGHNVRPQVVENYSGGDVPLPSGDAITLQSYSGLRELVGTTLVTSDGTTLLGG